jgi:hypothetical protein
MKPTIAATWMSTIHPNVASSPRAGLYQGHFHGWRFEISDASIFRASGEVVTAAVGPL